MNDQSQPNVVNKPLEGASPVPASAKTSAGHSPVVDAKAFNFKTALDRMIEGKKIAKLEWKNKDYGFINKKFDKLYIFREETGEHQWILCVGDIMGEDYVIVK